SRKRHIQPLGGNGNRDCRISSDGSRQRAIRCIPPTPAGETYTPPPCHICQIACPIASKIMIKGQSCLQYDLTLPDLPLSPDCPTRIKLNRHTLPAGDRPCSVTIEQRIHHKPLPITHMQDPASIAQLQRRAYK